MTESYILYIQTLLPTQAVLEIIFEPKTIAPLDGTNMIYARGSVYLAHAQPLPPTMQERYENQFGFTPTISIRYFPDGVSSVETAMTILAEGIMRWLDNNDDDLLLSANSKTMVIERRAGSISVNKNHSFWQRGRHKLITLPYAEVSP